MMRAKGLLLLVLAAVSARGGLLSRLEPIPPSAPVYGRLERIEAVRPDTAALTAFGPLDGVEGMGLDGLPSVEALDVAAAGMMPVAPAFGAIRARAGPLRPNAGPAFEPLGLSAVDLGLPALPVYAPLGGAGAVGLNRLLTPLDLWPYGPLGMLRAEADRAAADGDLERFEALSVRFWQQYRIAVQRRAVHGAGD